MSNLDIVRATEERLVNVWPSVTTILMDGWVIRMAGGYSGRANSASAVMQGARLDDALLAEIERLYAAEGLPPSVRVTPVCDAAVEPLLLARGYRVKDESLIMTLDLAAHRAHAADRRVAIDAAPGRGWLEGVCRHQSPDKRDLVALHAIVGRIRVPAAFATLSVDGRPAGFGMCAIDRGMAEIGSIVLDEALRGRGLGRALVESLLAWAVGEGAASAFLQVVAPNAVARGLYRSQGFVEIGAYRTMIKARRLTP